MKYLWGRRAVLMAVGFALWGVLLGGLAGCDKTSAELKAADASSNRAIDNRDGKKYAEHLSKGSFERLTKLISLARTATAKQTKALQMADKYDVLLIRATVEPERLRKMNAQEYIVRGVEDGEIWSTRGFKRVKYSVDAKRTQGSITYRPLFTKETFTLHWVKEDGAWKEDWVTSAADFSRWGRAAAKEENVSEDDFVLFLLDEWMGIEATEEIWNPVR